MKKIAIISSSYNDQSKSHKLAKILEKELKTNNKPKEQNLTCELFYLKELNLPFCDGADVYQLPQIVEIAKKFKEIDTFIFATPIYNYSVNAVAKNFIEIFGNELTEKSVGFVAASGGQGSFMALTSFINSLILDFRCKIIPKSVLATTNDWIDEETPNSTIVERLKELTIRVLNDI